ncbi:sulfite exporter TauE/SafE family protein [Desulfococcaceae bacterium HSG7]|nr:sulfite exporter TauE/SafE family protein [Desulfococcaceae bacterium HSG7]
MISYFILMPAILIISLILTMVGLGGGLIFAPLFILLAFPPSTAISASLFLNGIAALSAAIIYFRNKMVDFQLALPLIITSTLAAPLGALFTSKIDRKVLTGLLALIVFCAALRMLFGRKAESREIAVGFWRKTVGSCTIGLSIGFIGGLLGIGGGVFIVPLLIYVLKAPPKTAAATSIFIVVFSSFSGFVGHITMTPVDWRFILPAACFSFAGAQIGSRLMVTKIKPMMIKRIFGIILLLFAFRLLFKIQ